MDELTERKDDQNEDAGTIGFTPEMIQEQLKIIYGKSFKKYLKIADSFAKYLYTLDFIVLDEQWDCKVYSPDKKNLFGNFILRVRNQHQYDDAIRKFVGSSLHRLMLKRKFQNVYIIIKYEPIYINEKPLTFDSRKIF